MTKRVYNFSPGPAILPEPVLRHAQDELFALPGLGMSVLEISHRSAAFKEILASAKDNITKLLGLPADYHVLFLQGGARLQFSMVPMNLLVDRSADYIITGSWGNKALDEAKREGPITVAWDGKEASYDCLPSDGELNLSDDAAYVHFTSNETIQGVQFPVEPETGNVPLVCDASSDFLSRPLDIAKYGLIYACAQKNAGPAGVTVVMIRDDVLQRTADDLPGMLSYRNHAAENSLYNTAPVFGIYMVNLVAQWIIDQFGDLLAMQEQNRRKAAQLYQVIDDSDGYYVGHSTKDSRSLMNVTFRLANDELEKRFIQQAAQQGLCELKGHRSVGGIRASIYNAMPPAGVTALAEFMDEFKKK